MKNKKTMIKYGAIAVGVLIVGILLFVLGRYSNKRVEVEEPVVNKENTVKTIEEIKKNENIVFLGDSITDYYPIDSIYMDLPIINSGVERYTTKDILERLDTMVYQYNPTSVFLLIGTNDIGNEGEMAKEQTIENIEKIIEKIKRHRKMAKIYLESIYPTNKSINASRVSNRDNKTIQEINASLKKYCQKHDVTYIDMYKELQDEEGNLNPVYTDDGLHPNALGYAKISQVRLTYIYHVEVD